jgi:uncharacterized protein (UPF0276 family)
MRLGVSFRYEWADTALWDEVPKFEALEVIGDIGVDLTSCRRLRELYPGNRPLFLHFPQPCIGDESDEFQNQMTGMREQIEILKPTAISFHFAVQMTPVGALPSMMPIFDDPTPEARSVDQCLRRNIDFVKRFCPAVPILLENISVNWAPLPVVKRYLQYLKKVAGEHGVQLCFDLTNLLIAARGCDRDMAEILKSFAPGEIGYFHLAGPGRIGDHWVDAHDGLLQNAWIRTLVRRYDVDVVVEQDYWLSDTSYILGVIGDYKRYYNGSSS